MMERIDKHRAAQLLACPPRVVVAMAAAGKLPSAAKLTGEWSFDEVRLRDYIHAKETEACLSRSGRPQDAIGAVKLSGVAPLRVASSSAGLLTQTMRQLRKRVARPATSASSP
jgi:hypothetical protein